jgi:hypothetical protein
MAHPVQRRYLNSVQAAYDGVTRTSSVQHSPYGSSAHVMPGPAHDWKYQDLQHGQFALMSYLMR